MYNQGPCIVKVVKVDVCKLVGKEAHASEAGFLTQELSYVSCVGSICLDEVHYLVSAPSIVVWSSPCLKQTPRDVHSSTLANALPSHYKVSRQD